MTLDMYINKLNELRNELQTGDIPIVRVSNNYELGGNIVPINDHFNVGIRNMKLVKKQFVDDFDGIRYNTDVYVGCKNDDNDAVKVIFI